VLIAILGLLAFVPRSPARPETLKGLKPLGVILFAPAVAGIFVALQLGKDRGWNDFLAPAVLVASIVLIAYWAWDQSRMANPLIDVRSFGRRPILFGNLSVALLAMGGFQQGQITSLVLQVPKWTGAGFGLTAFMAGLIMACLNTVSLVASPLSGSMSRRVGVRRIAVTGALVMSLAWLTLALYRPSVLTIIVCLVPLMIGMAMLQAGAYITIVQATDPARTSEATGMSYIFLNLFIAIGGQIGFLLLATGQIADPAKGPGSFPTYDSFTLAYGFVTAVTALGVVVAAMIPKFVTPTSR
jgi:MFS family permease